MWKTHYGDYDHLARVKEWSATGGGEEEVMSAQTRRALRLTSPWGEVRRAKCAG